MNQSNKVTTTTALFSAMFLTAGAAKRVDAEPSNVVDFADAKAKAEREKAYETAITVDTQSRTCWNTITGFFATKNTATKKVDIDANRKPVVAAEFTAAFLAARAKGMTPGTPAYKAVAKDATSHFGTNTKRALTRWAIELDPSLLVADAGNGAQTNHQTGQGSGTGSNANAGGGKGPTVTIGNDVAVTVAHDMPIVATRATDVTAMLEHFETTYGKDLKPKARNELADIREAVAKMVEELQSLVQRVVPKDATGKPMTGKEATDAVISAVAPKGRGRPAKKTAILADDATKH